MNLSAHFEALIQRLRQTNQSTFRAKRKEALTASKLLVSTTPRIPTFVIVPIAGMHARLTNAVERRLSLPVGSSSAVAVGDASELLCKNACR